MEDLVKMIDKFPDLNLTVRGSELKELILYCILETKQQFETKEEPEQYISAKKTAEMLKVDISTLFRWRKRSYLCPIEHGGRRVYRLSQINKILEGK